MSEHVRHIVRIKKTPHDTEAFALAKWLAQKQRETGHTPEFREATLNGEPVACLFCGRFEPHRTKVFINTDGTPYKTQCFRFEARH